MKSHFFLSGNNDLRVSAFTVAVRHHVELLILIYIPLALSSINVGSQLSKLP